MPAPTNDNFTNAYGPLDTTLPAFIAGTTFDATTEGSEPTLFGGNEQSVWYYFTPASTGWYKFWIDDADIVQHNGRGLGLAIGSPTTLAGYTASAVETRVEHSTSQSFVADHMVALYLTASTTYRIRVYSTKASTQNQYTSDFTLRWNAFTPASNNDFANAQTLTLPATVAVDTFDSTWEAGEPVYNSGFYTAMQSRWYKFTVTTPGIHRVILSDADFVLTGHALTGVIDGVTRNSGSITVQIFKDFVDTLAEATDANALAVDGIASTSTKDVSITTYISSAGTYYIRVSTPYVIKSNAGYGTAYAFNAQTAATNMTVEAGTAPANDDFANATVLDPDGGTLSGETTLDSLQEATEPDVFTYSTYIEQSVWYKITPTTTQMYLFTIPLASLVYRGYSGTSSGEIRLGIWDQTALVDITTANLLRQDSIYADPGWSSQHDGTLFLTLTAGHTYYIKVASAFGTHNRSVCDFDLEWETLTPIANDDFANAQAISGASGSVSAFPTLASTVEASEPPSYYWNGEPQSTGTVWFDWTCPTTGDYVFKVQTMVDSPGSRSGNFDLAVWQGTSLGSLTKISRNNLGSENTEGRPWAQATAVGFHAISGQHYKIQVADNSTLNEAKLEWHTNTITGDSTTAPASMPNGRTNNYGNDDSEPPPNFATILASHSSWWFDDGQVGHVKWFKAVYSDTQTVTINGRQFDTVADTVTSASVGDIGLIVYKGANYASLTTPKIKGTTVDAAMMMSQGGFTGTGTAHAALFSLNTPGSSDGEVNMQVDVTAGDTLWICLFGLYDNATWIDSFTDSLDATQFELDLHVPSSAPVNDTWSAVYGLTNQYAYNLNQSKYAPSPYSWTNPHAGQRQGTTVGATADSGEVARAGFAATRSVWYYMSPDANETYKFWVESSVDCVLGIYDVNYGGALLSLIASDDDSGPGDQPEITIDFTWPKPPGIWTGNAIAVVVDSKTEGSFTLKFQRQTTGTPPANDDFADAVVISSIPWSASGTTVGASAEPEEGDAVELGTGPRDTVWYKYVATFNGRLKIKAACTSFNDDAYVYVDTWRGTTLDTLARDPNPPPQGPGGGLWRGFFNYYDTPAELEAQAINLDVISGQTYYIRVQTETGGSETFDIQTEVDATYVNIQPSGSEEFHGTLIDSAEILVDIQPSGVDHYSQITDAATVYINIQTAALFEVKAFEFKDIGTVYYNISIDSHDCQTKWDPSQLSAYGRRRYETRTNGRWNGTRGFRRYDVIGGDGLEEC